MALNARLRQSAPLLLSLCLHGTFAVLPALGPAHRDSPLPPAFEVEALWASKPREHVTAPLPGAAPEVERPLVATQAPAEPAAASVSPARPEPQPVPAAVVKTPSAEEPVLRPEQSRMTVAAAAPAPNLVAPPAVAAEPAPPPTSQAPSPAPTRAEKPATAAAQPGASRPSGQLVTPFGGKVALPALGQLGVSATTSAAALPAQRGRLVTAADGGWSAPTAPSTPTATAAAPAPVSSAPPAGTPPTAARPAAETVTPPAPIRPVAEPPATPAASSGPPPGYTSARPTRQVEPHYPREARKKGQAGTVHLTLQVRPDGRVDKVTVSESSGFPLLDEAAVAAARSWRYEPARDQGRPVAETKRLAMVFRLED